jgi:hypothetical protein
MGMQPLNLDDPLNGDQNLEDLQEKILDDLKTKHNEPEQEPEGELLEAAPEVSKEEPKEEDPENLLEPAPEEQPKVRKGKSAQDRIRELVAERNHEREEKEAAKREAHQWKRAALDTQKTTAENQKATLAKQLTLIKSQMAKAHQDGDSERYVELTSQLNETQVQLMALDRWIAPTLEEEPQSQPKDNPTGAPEELLDWVERNKWYSNPQTDKDKMNIQRAIRLYDILVLEGWDPNESDFYNEIDVRLGLARKGNTSVQSSQVPLTEEALKPQTPAAPRRNRVPVQTVQGASRAGPAKPNPNKRELTAREKRMAEIMGVSEAEYLKQAIKAETAEKQGSRMVSLADKERN